MTIEFAKSLSGHDKNQFYMILKKEEKFVWLVNGTTHTLEKPKKKNPKHFQIIYNVPQNITERLMENEILSDDIIRWAITNYKKAINL